jgi:antitoxin component YwqK of YwqJK toxin-antitoxin module
MKGHYESGALMYEGMIVNGEGFFGNDIPAIGQHRAYYESGNTKAIIDYDRYLIKVYDSTENIIFDDSLSRWRGRTIKGYYNDGQKFLP